MVSLEFAQFARKLNEVTVVRNVGTLSHGLVTNFILIK
jgi:hypothetical protein